MAISTVAFMLPRFFVQTHIFFVSPSTEHDHFTHPVYVASRYFE